jgi:hypothetical protein
MNADAADLQIAAGALGTAAEIGLHPTSPKRPSKIAKRPAATPHEGTLGQTGRTLSIHDWEFPNAIPNAWGAHGEDLMRGWLLYEYARESITLRNWARFLVAATRPNVSFASRMKRRAISARLERSFNSGRDGWISGFLVAMARHLAVDRPWTEIDEAERNSAVAGAICSFGAQHFLAGDVGDVRERAVGVRLASRAETRQPAYTREDQFQSLTKPKRRRGKRTEVHLFEISWRESRNDELVRSFGATLPELRPKNHPEPPRRSRAEKSGIKPASLCTALRNLGMMRLCHALQSRNAERQIGMDPKARNRSRGHAATNFRGLFPFLPLSEHARAEQLFRDRKP